MTKGNLALWDRLGKTDPKHTKGFKRSGGFTGTAVKPIYTEHKMTEEFGPAGKGWGMGEPSFQIVPGHNGEVLVYCTVSLWYVAGEGEVCTVFGVGGDKVVSYIKANEQYNRPERWENDDEALKKAFTDAIGNAMKHIGMSADVHMGLFDDSKYVREVTAEMAGDERAPRQDAPVGDGAAPGQFATPESKAKARDLSGEVIDALREAGNKGRAALRAYWESEEFQTVWETLPKDWRAHLTEEKDAFIASYGKVTARVDPNASLDQQFRDTVGAPQ